MVMEKFLQGVLNDKNTADVKNNSDEDTREGTKQGEGTEDTTPIKTNETTNNPDDSHPGVTRKKSPVLEKQEATEEIPSSRNDSESTSAPQQVNSNPEDISTKRNNFYESVLFKMRHWRSNSGSDSVYSREDASVDSDAVIDTMKKIWQDTYLAKKNVRGGTTPGKTESPHDAMVPADKVGHMSASMKRNFRSSSMNSSRYGSGRLHSRQSTIRIKGRQGWVRKKTDSRTSSLALMLIFSFIAFNLPYGIAFIVFRTVEANGNVKSCAWQFFNQVCMMLHYACHALNLLYFYISLKMNGAHFDCICGCFAKK